MGVRRAVSLLLLLAAGGAAEPSSLLSSADAKSLENAARMAARKGRRAEVKAIATLWVDLGATAGDASMLLSECEPLLGRAKKEAPVSEAARLLRRIAKNLGDTLAARPLEEQRRVAGLVLRLDGQHEASHRVLAHLRRGGGWMTEEVARVLPRRAEILDAIRRARSLDIPIESGASSIELLPQVNPAPAVRLACGSVRVHSATLPEPKLRRILLQVMRAGALSQWIRTGKLVPPRPPDPLDFVYLGSRAEYEKWIDLAAAAGQLPPDRVAFARSLNFFAFRSGVIVCDPAPEAHVESQTLLWMLAPVLARDLGGEPQPAVLAGHLHWLCLTFLGTEIPRLAWIEKEVEERRERRTGSIQTTEEYREMVRLSQAGLLGLRAWMIYLASRGADPKWQDAMLDELGKVTGDELLKATSVAEFLQERGMLDAMMRGTYGATGAPEDRAPAFEGVWGAALADLEARWKEWLLPVEGGLADRLDGGAAAGLTPEQRGVLAHLESIRAAGIPSGETHPISLDDELSAGCLLHARYLAQNPKQLAAWPDAHEEWPDCPGFSPEGSWAGLHSVIAPGARSPEEAIDGWMGTFYHRLPLLDPGIVRIGWGMEKQTAVLDATSLAGPAEFLSVVCWPPDGARDVPRRFRPELPNPVPGADQSAWGYPVTIQWFGFEPKEESPMRLCEGGSGAGARVECILSTPGNPSNPELAPRGAYCLIPRQPLKAKSTYTVVTRHPRTGDGFSWHFTTGP